MIAKFGKDFVRVAKRIAKRGAKLGILPARVVIGRSRMEVSDGFVVLSVAAAPTEAIVSFDPAVLRATHGGEVGSTGTVDQRGVTVTGCDTGPDDWPDFGAKWYPGAVSEDWHVPFVIEPQLLIDALDGYSRKDGAPVKIQLPRRPGRPVLIDGHLDSEQAMHAFVMPQQPVVD